MSATREGKVDDLRIAIFDGLVPYEQVVQMKRAFDQNAFTRSEFARPDTAALRHWARDIELDASRQLPLHSALMSATQQFTAKAYRAYRAYCNYASFGDMLFSHRDCAPDEDELTALWYLAERWDIEWGGETLFFDEADDAVFVCSPKPGRLVLFDSAIKHAARAPTRVCTEPRYTFAYKLERAPPGS